MKRLREVKKERKRKSKREREKEREREIMPQSRLVVRSREVFASDW